MVDHRESTTIDSGDDKLAQALRERPHSGPVDETLSADVSDGGDDGE